MKNILFYSLLAAMFALPVAASAGEHHKVDCKDKANAEHAECKKHEAAPAAAH